MAELLVPRLNKHVPADVFKVAVMYAVQNLAMVLHTGIELKLIIIFIMST